MVEFLIVKFDIVFFWVFFKNLEFICLMFIIKVIYFFLNVFVFFVILLFYILNLGSGKIVMSCIWFKDYSKVYLIFGLFEFLLREYLFIKVLFFG